MSNSIEADSDLDIDSLLKNKYFNFQIEDWYGHNIYTKGESRKIIIQCLFKIYHKWNTELKKINKPYYLAIWLNEPRLFKSEVVCGIDEEISYYEVDAFRKSEKLNKIDINHYGNLSGEFLEFDWERHIDFDYFFETDRKYHKKREVTHIVEKDNDKMYFYSEGDVWIGKKKLNITV
ncbi:hypothetical protein [Emticicia sp.]|uniref:hypothetical protein n=1 Tax=Emticicia sp. TaxID=1930953 RepID=UPI0037501FC0